MMSADTMPINDNMKGNIKVQDIKKALDPLTETTTAADTTTDNHHYHHDHDHLTRETVDKLLHIQDENESDDYFAQMSSSILCQGGGSGQRLQTNIQNMHLGEKVHHLVENIQHTVDDFAEHLSSSPTKSQQNENENDNNDDEIKSSLQQQRISNDLVESVPIVDLQAKDASSSPSSSSSPKPERKERISNDLIESIPIDRPETVKPYLTTTSDGS